MANTSVTISDGESKSNSLNVCGICNENSSKYCCPRCEIYYCSLDCYKSENHQNCSESFYKECVDEELAGNYTDEESRQKMIDILQRLNKEQGAGAQDIDELLQNLDNGEDENCIDSDDEDCVDLEERVKGLNLDDADAVWNALTEDERNEFEALLNQGDVGSFIPQWEPWWNHYEEEKLVKEIMENSKADKDYMKNCPTIIKVPQFSSLTSVQPSPAIKNNITNVLASYAFIIRYFNGDLEPVEGTVYLLNICANLDNNTNFEDTSVAVESVAQNCLKSELIQTDKPSLDAMKHDTFLILQGPSTENKPFYCQAALSHLHSIFKQAKTAQKSVKTVEKKSCNKNDFTKKFQDHGSDHFSKLDVSKVKKCMKKVEYYLSYIESHGMDFE
ncbi:zinc finger HIT domain-containing protein 2 [Plutella xylostella]|uniref:zinc finger HIT domain-containing protein 2 n=1 Tax=Plutella xylostella TaxID=51655 RepID=UPI002032D041|nr:zinc finger HIT domain-containing protein 2 [Plutella xylostella]